MRWRGWWGPAVVMFAVVAGCSYSPLALPVSAASAWLETSSSSPLETSLKRAERHFITQYHHARWNPNETRFDNANCGPAALAMALKAYGREPKDLADRSASGLISRVRRAMTGTTEDDNWTYPVQVLLAAPRFGLRAEYVFGVVEIRRAMRRAGRMVVLNLNPTPAYVHLLTRPYDGGHFALLTAVNGDRATLCDPLASSPVMISLGQLAQALATPLGEHSDGRLIPPFNGGVLLWE
ncbi:MAG: hypothetical protein VKN33_06080 [Candidatus Sericytochromatia bacterium]|nr:hypothetical protein [Candidatus Sericytochromatia bacterium]